MTDEDFDVVVSTHLRGTFTCARAAAVRMRAQEEGGRIVVVGSPAGQRGNFGQTNYAAAKAGIVAFARTWAMELARSDITVNAIVPTAWTRMTASIPVYEPLVERVEAGSRSRARSARRTPSGCRRTARRSSCSWPPTPAAGVTGQAIGIGGDRLSMWSHPEEVARGVQRRRLDPEQIAENWTATVGAAEQTYGVHAAAAGSGGA